MTTVQRRPFDCPLTEERCTRPGCKRGLCVQELTERRQERERLDAEAREQIAKQDERLEPKVYEIAREKVKAETKYWGAFRRRKMVTINGQRMALEAAIEWYVRAHRAELEREAKEALAPIVVETLTWD